MGRLIYIRTDANSHLGMGHVMRCASIAAAWQEAGGSCLFLVADKESADRVAEMGYESVCLNGDWHDMEKELSALLAFLEEHPADALLLDSYYITRTYMEPLAGRIKVIYLGMANVQAKPVDMLINYTIMADRGYYGRQYPKKVKKLLGCSYFPLRSEFLGRRIPIRDETENVLLLTGATDPLHVAWELADKLLAGTELSVHAVAGAYNMDKALLYSLKGEYGDRLFLYENVKNMAELFAGCDMAVSAGGVTLYELCACGVPTLSFAFADNQLPAVRCFEQKGIIPSVGDIRSFPGWHSRLVKMLMELSQDKERRTLMSEKMTGLVDGAGSRRIVEAIMDMLGDGGNKVGNGSMPCTDRNCLR